MKEYLVTVVIKQILPRELIIEAESEESAVERVKNEYPFAVIHRVKEI